MSQKEENLCSPDIAEVGENLFNPQSLAISTAVHYPKWYPNEINYDDNDEKRLSDKVRGDLALEMIQKAKNKGYQVIVVDSESSSVFTQRLKELEIKRLFGEKRGMSTQRQLGFKEASTIATVKYLCWMEPEKISLIDYLPDLVRPILDGKADVVVPKRREKEFRETYPNYQVNFEKQSNQLWNNMLRKFDILPKDAENLDVFFGPKIFRNTPKVREVFLAEYVYQENPELTPLSNKAYRPDQYSNAIMFPIIVALFQKLRVVGIEIPYKHPEQQTKIESNSDIYRKRRADQQREIIRTSADFCRMLIKTNSHTIPIN